MGVTRIVETLIAPLRRRVRLMARRAVVTLINDDPKLQELQISLLAGEADDAIERFQDYGFTSHPHPRAEAIVLALTGDTEQSVAIRVDDREYRLTGLAQGEVALYDDQGQKIHLKRNKEIEVSGCDKLTATVGQTANITAGASITAIAPAVNLGAASGLQQLIDARFKALFETHTHKNVQPGTGNSGPPNQTLELADVATSVTKAI